MRRKVNAKSETLFLSCISANRPFEELGSGLQQAVLGTVCSSSFLMLFTGIHPTTISESFEKAAAKAVEILTNMATPVALSDRESLLKSAMTSLSSKVSEVGNKNLSLR